MTESIAEQVGDTELELWVVYRYPSDYPGRWVIRRQYSSAAGVRPDPEVFALCDTLDEAHAALPDGLVRIQPPGADPDPVVWEVWL
jgi:hypothetical protein